LLVLLHVFERVPLSIVSTRALGVIASLLPEKRPRFKDQGSQLQQQHPSIARPAQADDTIPSH
jgi:hypothetical protein